MKKRQQGLTTVEAAIGAALMLILLFGAIEVARVIFVYNFLDEVTRRGARVAAVCPFNHPGIREVAVFADPLDGTVDTQSPFVQQLQTGDVKVEYLDAAGNKAPFGGNEFAETKFVRAYVDSFDLNLLFFPTAITTPEFSTILPSEDLGFDPGPGDYAGKCRCFKTPGKGTDGCDWKDPPT
jgi:Flp pilus assembly protein TadG